MTIADWNKPIRIDSRSYPWYLTLVDVVFALVSAIPRAVTVTRVAINRWRTLAVMLTWCLSTFVLFITPYASVSRLTGTCPITL